MMFLVPDSVNVEVLELSQVNQAYSIDFIFQILDVQQNSVVWFLAANTSTARARYDRFNIELNTVTDPANGVIDLERGQYTYKVWEYNGGAIDETGTTGDVLATGKVVVDFEPKNNYDTSNIYI